MNPVHHRLVIYTEDVMNLTGRRHSVAYELLSRVRKKANALYRKQASRNNGKI